MSDGKTQNINISGGNIGGLQVGDNNTQGITQNMGGELTVPQVFDAITKSLPSVEHQADDDSAGEVEEAIVNPLLMMAQMPAEEQKKPDTMERAQSLISRLVPYAPQIAKGLAVFGEAALSALASRNPIVAGVLAVCKLETKD